MQCHLYPAAEPSNESNLTVHILLFSSNTYHWQNSWPSSTMSPTLMLKMTVVGLYPMVHMSLFPSQCLYSLTHYFSSCHHLINIAMPNTHNPRPTPHCILQFISHPCTQIPAVDLCILPHKPYISPFIILLTTSLSFEYAINVWNKHPHTHKTDIPHVLLSLHAPTSLRAIPQRILTTLMLIYKTNQMSTRTLTTSLNINLWSCPWTSCCFFHFVTISHWHSPLKLHSPIPILYSTSLSSLANISQSTPSVIYDNVSIGVYSLPHPHSNLIFSPPVSQPCSS